MDSKAPPRPPKKEVLKMMAGFRRFRDRYFARDGGVFEKLSSQGQHPKTLMIACSDSRVDPALLFSTSPGEVFVVRNVANLVPPFETSQGFHGVSAAIEFAVVYLNVKNIAVLGHGQCGGIRSLFEDKIQAETGFVKYWMSIAESAKQKSLAKNPTANLDQLCRHCEHESIVTSLSNLKTFPFIQKALDNQSLELHGLYFDIELGELSAFDESSGEFLTVITQRVNSTSSNEE
jgi:carbonic anhydrase